MVSEARLKVVILSGPTATGKTELALALAARSDQPVEIINADSLLVYRGMNIGTAKPSAQELQTVCHHLIDIRDPNEPFTAGDFVRGVESALADIHARERRALIVGGTGFYLKALLYGMWGELPSDPSIRAELDPLPDSELARLLKERDPASAERIGPQDRYRLVRALELIRVTGKTPTELQAARPSEPDPRFELWVIDRPNEVLYPRIAARVRQMLDSGLVAEVEDLRQRFPQARALGAVGYAQVGAFLDGRKPEGRALAPGLPGLTQEIELATRQLVKRQRTWFRSLKTARHYPMDAEREALEARWKETAAPGTGPGPLR